MGGRFQYLLVLGGCLVLTLPLEFVFRARVWRRPRRLLRAVLPGVLLFGAWDLWAIADDHWRFSERLTTGWKIPPNLPVEEIVFFVAIPMCALLTFEALRSIERGDIWRPGRRR
jgi:lycopene cyclase domain-containing protein